MSPSLALLVWFMLLLALLRFDPAKEPGISVALWVPLIWLFIIGSRLPSQWFGGQVGQVAAALEEGNALDRNIFSILILLAIGILISRSFKWGDFFAHNFALMTLLSFGLLSVLWSDFPFVALKRWFRDLGLYLVLLVVLSDPHPLEAVCTLLRRLSYLLIPLCILLIKYYPSIGKEYDSWTGMAFYVGATTSKNMLGVLCLISGLFFFCDTLTRWCERKERLTRRILIVNVSFIAMTLWLMHMSSSATSRLCMVLGCVVIVVAHSKTARNHPALLKVLIPLGICLYLVLVFGLGVDINAVVAEAVGRDPTLTDRTLIWKTLLSMHTNPLIGTGYESFWLGSRLLKVWESDVGRINEAHNGYLQTYLQLGIIGLSILSSFLIASYRTICRRFESLSSLGLLGLALWTVLMFYNVTEASFQGGLLWLTFFLVAIDLGPGGGEQLSGHRSVACTRPNGPPWLRSSLSRGTEAMPIGGSKGETTMRTKPSMNRLTNGRSSGGKSCGTASRTIRI
jgi:O-antigen ligase